MRPIRAAAAVLIASSLIPAARAGEKPKKLYVAVFDFASGRPADAQKLADTIRVRLRRHEGYEVIDRLTTREVAETLGIDADPAKVTTLLTDRIGVHIGVYGSLEYRGGQAIATLRCIDVTDPEKPGGWAREFRDDSERARAVISKAVVETIRGAAEWEPPEYGDEPEPQAWPAGPVNANGRFDGSGGWDAPDNAATFIKPDPRGKGKGKALKITTNLERAPWIAYRRRLRFGQADPSNPPKIGRDSSYASVAGMEGVHYRSEWIDATGGQRYWLIADMKGKTAGIFFPKIFVKGYLDYSDHAEALPEVSLVQRKMTARQFANLPPERQKALVAEDVRAHPERYRRECFRWYLACRNEEDVWKHYAAPLPPRGGLPKNVQWLRIEIYAYWPPGDFWFDDVLLYKDPRQEAPLPEEAPRSKFFKKGGIQPQPE